MTGEIVRVYGQSIFGKSSMMVGKGKSKQHNKKSNNNDDNNNDYSIINNNSDINNNPITIK